MSDYHRSGSLLSASQSRLLIVDVQQKLAPLVHEHEQLIAKCEMLCHGAKVTGVPIFATEQYPSGLGGTVEPLAQLVPAPLDKVRFSAAEVLGWNGTDAEQPHQIVVAGIETHVCIQQTCFDLLAGGFQVFVVADAVSSRNPLDHAFALQRMRDSGVSIITTEVALFEWCEVAGSDQFKQISRLITGRT